MGFLSMRFFPFVHDFWWYINGTLYILIGGLEHEFYQWEFQDPKMEVR